MTVKKLTRETIRREYKRETDAAWSAMDKRWSAARLKMEKAMDRLAKVELREAIKPVK